MTSKTEGPGFGGYAMLLLESQRSSNKRMQQTRREVDAVPATLGVINVRLAADPYCCTDLNV